jgi:hypothetical protein
MKYQIVPCPIRDHHEVARELIVSCGATPINPEAAAALQDTTYHIGMQHYGHEMKVLTDPIWIEGYQGNTQAKVM